MEMKELGKGSDRVSAGALIPIMDLGRWKAKWTIHKFQDADGQIEKLAKLGVSLDAIMRRFMERFIEKLEMENNLLLNEGINELWTLCCGTGATKWDNTNARIGVGNSNAAADPTQTGLQGASKAFKAMDATYPTYGSAQKATWRATFGSAEGNFAWEEITVVNAADDTGKNLNRKVQSMGTKASGKAPSYIR